jgi:hypothetical protein
MYLLNMCMCGLSVQAFRHRGACVLLWFWNDTILLLIQQDFPLTDSNTNVSCFLFPRNQGVEFTPLLNLRCHDVNTVVRVRVVRKWDFRGLSDNGPIQHVYMALVDEEVCFFSTLLYLCRDPIYKKGHCSFHCLISFTIHSCFTEQFF